MLWLVVGLFLLILAVVLLVFMVSSVLATFKGAPFVPMSRKQVKRVVELAKAKPGDKVIDLGSGDGRLVVAFARNGAMAEGYEIQPLLVWWSQLVLWLRGLSQNSLVRRQNLWTVDCAGAQVVTLYAFPSMMAGLEQKLQQELAPGTRVVSLAFSFPNWQPVVTEGKMRVYER